MFSAGLSRHEDEGHASKSRRDVDQMLQYFEPRHDRQVDIAQYEIGFFFEDGEKTFLTIVRSTQVETAVAEFCSDCRSGLAVGFDAQNFLHARSCHASPQMRLHATQTGAVL